MTLRKISVRACAKIFFNFLYYFLPNLSHYSFITNAAHGDVPPVFRDRLGDFLRAAYIAILIAAAILDFQPPKL